MNIPYFRCDNKQINTAYRLAIANLYANILPFQDGILEKEEPVIIAGLGYVTPWTRDAAINTWNAGGMICPEICLNTLKSVLEKVVDGYKIGGEYWDAIIWTTGAWNQYLYTGDLEFLKMAYNATINSLAYYEETEFDVEKNLFRGAACYGDGVAAYPDIYACHGQSGIIRFAEVKEYCNKKGVGIPMMALSTNCLYYNAYVIADKMAEELGKAKKYEKKAQAMHKAINQYFWSEEKGNYRYLVDDFGGCDHEEGLGSAFAILFGVADEEKTQKVLKNQYITAKGIPCVWPTFDRYLTEDGMGFGRHSGTVWPHVQGFWADAAAKNGDVIAFDREMEAQTENAVKDYQFAEIYHPITGEIYGGRQERGKGIVDWRSEPYQTWSATAYLRNVYMNLIGMNFDTNGIHFCPVNTKLLKTIKLSNFKYRNCVLNISIKWGTGEMRVLLDGVEAEPFISATISGTHEVEIQM